MRRHEERLAEILERETHLYEDLRGVKDDEARALLVLSSVEIEASTAKQERLVEEAMRLEQERRDIVLRLSAGHGPWDHEPSLREIAPYLSPDIRRRVIQSARALSAVCVDIGKAQISNSGLIRRSIDYLHDFMETLLRRAQARAAVYGPTGTFYSGKEAVPGFVDRKI
ncbi:MAG: flagellar protein FlgN [Candidatus Omnitrophica bacterium]|nr:hypothetical protein [bacterium]NUN96942.1 flagellar protein FlgN [Candidatus Omnitrophota bacterium]